MSDYPPLSDLLPGHFLRRGRYLRTDPALLALQREQTELRRAGKPMRADVPNAVYDGRYNNMAAYAKAAPVVVLTAGAKLSKRRTTRRARS